MSRRFGILDRLRDNWPGQFDPGRVSFLEKELRDFDDDTLNEAVTLVLREEKFPPKLADFFSRCREIQKKQGRAKKEKGFVPGDIINGEKTLTPSEALAELKKIKEEYPEAFDHNVEVPEGEMAGRFSAFAVRWYVLALHKCIAWDPKIEVPDDLKIRRKV